MDKARRKALRRQAKDAEYTEVRRRLGFGEKILRSLRHDLNEASASEVCDHSLRLTRDWATNHTLDPDRVAQAVQTFGGTCDHEVLAKVTPDRFGWRD